ncbi:hypothetical protein V2J09_002270 [Rumex salicifolius]
MKVVQARLIRSAPNPRPPTSLFSPLSLSSSPSLLPPAVRRRTNTVRSVQSDDKEKEKEETMTRNPNDTTGDVMSHSFGEGYATRSDEEGFGGIYAGNDSTSDPNNQPHKPVIHENHPEYDRNQGSQVSGKEKARNQEKVDH